MCSGSEGDVTAGHRTVGPRTCRQTLMKQKVLQGAQVLQVHLNAGDVASADTPQLCHAKSWLNQDFG